MEGSTRMRSSIACLRCRKSKIKCDNSGHLDSACENCIKSGHKCEWPDPTPLPPKRSEPTNGHKQDKEAGHERKRLKKFIDSSAQDSQRYAEDILAARFLDRDVWDQVFATYKRHFATELPFLHIPTLKDRLSRADKENKSNSELNLVLLGILALTARYHSDLVKYVDYMSQDKPNSKPQNGQDGKGTPTSMPDRNIAPKPRGRVRSEAAAASEFFANALDKALGSLRTAMTRATVERVQAFLMLGLYHWIVRGDHAGLGSWMYVGVAIRMAQALKLGFGDKEPIGGRLTKPLTEAEVIDREVRRRTMFSCFILDRLLSCGQERVSFIRSKDLQIQLPCTEEDFDLTRRVHTGFLRSFKELGRPADNPNVLSLFVQLVDLWGDISRFSYTGGRFSEPRDVSPLDERSMFNRLRRKLEDFDEHVRTQPAFLSFTLTRSNYFKHDNRQGSSTFVSFHMLLALCKIMLHREFIPYLPIKCRKPSGPLDPPTFPPEVVPPSYFEDSAKELFRAGADIIELIDICGDKLPHSSLVVFTIWNAAYISVYARHFPHMDMEHSLVTDEDIQERMATGATDSTSGGACKTAWETLNRLAQHSNLAALYVTLFRDLDDDYTKSIADYNRHVGNPSQQPQPPNGAHGLGVRMGGATGGLEEWVKRRERLTSNGYIIDSDDRLRIQYDGSDRSRGSTMEPGSSIGPESTYAGTTASVCGVRTPRTQPAQFLSINTPQTTPPVPSLPSMREDPRNGVYGHPQQSPGGTHYVLPGSPGQMGPNMGPEVNGQPIMEDVEGKRFGTSFLDIPAFVGLDMEMQPNSWNWDPVENRGDRYAMEEPNGDMGQPQFGY